MKERGSSQGKLPPMVAAYLKAREFSMDTNLSEEKRLKFNNSLGTLEHFMSEQDRRLLRQKLMEEATNETLQKSKKIV